MTNRFFLSHTRSVMIVLVALTGLIGCKQDEQIARHRIEKSRSGLGSLRTTSASSEPDRQTKVAQTDRMVVALFLMSDATWFF